MAIGSQANPRPAVVAHRGASREAPENTLAAFRLAWDLGADAVECDIRETTDGRVVCMHDADTQRVAGVDWKIKDTPFARLRTLDVGRWKGERWAGERIPTLAEVLATVPAHGKIFVEVKTGPGIVPRLRRIVAAAPLRSDQVVVISFHAAVVSRVREEMPETPVLLLQDIRIREETGVPEPSVEEIVDRLRRTGAHGLDVHAVPAVDADFIETVRSAGFGVHAWTVNDPARAAELARWGVASITTDRPAAIRQALAALRADADPPGGNR